MKLGNWIQISAMLLTTISASPLHLTSNKQDKSTLTEKDFLDAVAKMQSSEKPDFKHGAPCFSAPIDDK